MGFLSTCWTEGVDGPGSGEWIVLTFPGTVEVTSIGVDIGYDRDDDDTTHRKDLFTRNNRVKRAIISFSGGESVQWTFADKRGVQTIPLDRTPGKPIQTTYVKLEIEEVYPGTHYDDTCIAEIEVWGRAK